MTIAVRARGFTLTEALMHHVQDRIEHSLDWARDRVGRVEVRLGDINGDHGGEDKMCHAIVHVNRGRQVVIKSVSGDLYAAIADVAARARGVVARQVERARQRRRDRQSIHSRGRGH